MGRDGVPGAEILQGAHRVGAKLQAGADFIKGRGFFKNMRGLPMRARPSPAARPAIPPPTMRKGESAMAHHGMKQG